VEQCGDAMAYSNKQLSSSSQMGSKLSSHESISIDDVESMNLDQVLRLGRFIDDSMHPFDEKLRVQIAKRRMKLLAERADTGKQFDEVLSPLWTFCPTRNRWRLSDCAPTQAPTSLSVLTFNIWFDAFALEARLTAFVDLLKKKMPDVVCIQEATPKRMKLLLEDTWVRATFDSTDLEGETFDAWYGVALLVKRGSACAQVRFRSFGRNSDQGRKAVIVDFADLSVSCVHLESLDSSDERATQLQIIKSMLGARPALICGDFNFDSLQNFKPDSRPLENDRAKEILAGFVDAWEQLHPDERGATFDAVGNSMMACTGETWFGRIDRVFARATATVKSIEIVGNTPFGREGARDLYIPTTSDCLHKSSTTRNVESIAI
jgi:endonuclease/exonuclease/phosphatase family metal-dependent hydrolase